MRKPIRPLLFLLLGFSGLILSLGAFYAASGSKVEINSDKVLVIDGRKVFPIGFTMPPSPGGKAPNGKNGIEELHEAGATFLRTGAFGGAWNTNAIDQEQQWEDTAAQYGMHCWVHLRELDSIGTNDGETEAMLRKVVNRFKNHPGLGAWKAVDEPQWGKHPIEPMVRAYRILKELDKDHPIAVTHAPRGTVEELRAYNSTADIVAADIYPVSYPPGTHSLRSNKEISMVGDYTRTMMEVAGDKMPVWMILQISWSGVLNPGKTLRFATFPQERFMTYQAIINGARGLFFFGGHNPGAWTPADARLGWAWSFWNRVLRPVVEEIGEKSQLYPALVAPPSALPVTLALQESFGGKAEPGDVEVCVREVNDDIFILACKREGATVRVEFSGLPAPLKQGEVLFESPRKVEVRSGKFSDWFAPFDVHVYRFSR
ncbi:MAG TPA: hypothetical protein VGL91_09130 [Acidobacteriota bacterium]|jgi:hypothetical protein